MASRPSIIACGIRMAAVAMAMKFLAGPALMAASSTAFGLRGRSLRVAIMQVSQLLLFLISTCNQRMKAKQFTIYIAGSSPSRSRSICFCQRVQCSSGYIEHRVIINTSMHLMISTLSFHLDPLNNEVSFGVGFRVIFGMLITLPIALVYYLLLAL